MSQTKLTKTVKNMSPISDTIGGDSEKKEIPIVASSSSSSSSSSAFASILEAGAQEAYSRPWHRIERGLRLNRIRIFVEGLSLQFEMTNEEKDSFFIFLQKSLDKKLLNTLKVVSYDQETQRIVAIKGLEVKRNSEGVLKWSFTVKKSATDTTRKKKKTTPMSP
jgi:hypothetical protein